MSKPVSKIEYRLQPVELSIEDKAILEEVSGQKIYLRKNFGENNKAVEGLLEQGKSNALENLNRHKLGHKLSMFEENNLMATLKEFQNLFSLSIFPAKMECYDISHISGKMAYGSMVVFVNGRPMRKFYRIFKVKERNNDFENLKEMLGRRLERGFEFAKE